MNKEHNSNEQEQFVRLDWRLTGIGQIPCKLRKGTWSGQYSITIKVRERLLHSSAYKSFVEEDESGKTGWVRVRIVKEEEKELVICLPNETLNSGPHITVSKDMVRGIKVPKELVQPA